jgi:transcription initiation factor TFIIB
MLKHLVVPHQYISPYGSDPSNEKLVCPLCNKSDPAALITDYETNEIICCRCGNVISEKNALADQRKLSNEDDDHEPAKYQLENVQINRQLSQQSNNLDNTLIVKTKFYKHDDYGKCYSINPIRSSSSQSSTPKLSWPTMIGRATKDAFGNPISDEVLDQIKRMRILDLRIESKLNKSLRQASRQILFLKDRLCLSDFVMEKILYLYKKAYERGIIRRRSVSLVVAAAICVAYREIGSHRTLRDICDSCSLKYKELAQTYRLLVTELDLKVPNVNLAKYIPKLASKMNVSKRTEYRAIKMINHISGTGMCMGKNPITVAAAILYVCSIKNGETMKQIDIARVAGISDTGLRIRIKDIVYNKN